MDSLAYERIFSYYLNDFEKELNKSNPFSDFLRSTPIGIPFRSMIDLERFRSLRDGVLKKLKEQIRSVALKKDAVIPPDGIISTLTGKYCGRNSQVEVWDFPFPYSHENPFPVLKNQESSEVDKGFRYLLSTAGSFLK